jgi:hypothetical protein
MVFLTMGSSFALTPHSVFDLMYNNFSFLPNYYLDVDVSTFAHPKNDEFYTSYLAENNTQLEFTFLSFRDVIHSVWMFNFQNGMGRQDEGIFFDPQRIDYGLIPSLEYRRLPVFIRGGLDHHCFHQIDRYRFPTIYWNRLFLHTGTKNMQLANYWRPLAADSLWTPENRLSWNTKLNVYLWDFLGLVGEGKLNGYNDKTWEMDAEARYAFYRRYSWIMALRGQTTFGYWNNKRNVSDKAMVFWKLTVCYEQFFRRGKQGANFFFAYTLDSMPKYIHEGEDYDRLSRDQLLQIGIRFFR